MDDFLDELYGLPQEETETSRKPEDSRDPNPTPAKDATPELKEPEPDERPQTPPKAQESTAATDTGDEKLAQPTTVIDIKPKSAIEKVTETQMVEELVSGNLSPENAKKCREVIGCAPVNLMSPTVQAALFKYNPSLREAFDFDENPWTKGFVIGINESSNKMCSSIISAAIARSQLRVVISSMGQNTRGRSEMVQFGQDLQSIFLDLAERTQNFVLVMAKTIGKMGQVAFALKYGANPDVLVKAIARVLEPMGTDIEQADRVHAVAIEEVMKMQRFIQESMLSDDSRFSALEKEKEDAGNRLQKAELAVVAVKQKRIDTLVEHKGTISRANAQIEAYQGHITRLEDARLASDARVEQLQSQIAQYRKVEAALDRLKFKRQPHPPEQDWGSIMERTLMRGLIDPNKLQKRLEAKEQQALGVLQQKFANLGTVEAQIMAQPEEEKAVEVQVDRNVVAERVEANDVVADYVQANDNLVAEVVPEVKLEDVVGLIDENALRNTLKQEMANEIQHRTTAIEQDIERVKEEVEALKQLERELGRDGAKASDGRSVETTTRGWWWWKTRYTKVVQGYNEKEAVRKMQQFAQEDIVKRRTKLDELSQQLARVQTDVRNDIREVHQQRLEQAQQNNTDLREAVSERNASRQKAAEATRRQRAVDTEETNRQRRIDSHEQNFQNRAQAEEINRDRRNDAARINKENKQQAENILRQRERDAAEINKARKQATFERNQERKRLTEEINRKRKAQAEQINEARRAQEAQQRVMLMESHRKALDTAMRRAESNNHQVTEDAKNLVAKMQEHHRKMVASVDTFNAKAEERFNEDKMKRLERIDGQKGFLQKMIDSTTIKKAGVGDEIRLLKLDIGAEEEKIERSQQSLLRLEEKGDIAQELDNAVEAQQTANQKFDEAAAAFDAFAKEFDQRTGAQFTSMMRMVRFLDESISNLPAAMKALDGVFREAMATLGGDTFRETMESIPDEGERRKALGQIARNLQDVSEIGWKMFDAPLKSLMRKEAFEALAHATVEMAEREQAISTSRPAIEEATETGPIIEEVVEDDEMPPRRVREMLTL